MTTYTPTTKVDEQGNLFCHQLKNTGIVPDELAWYPDYRNLRTEITEEKYNLIIAHYRAEKRKGQNACQFAKLYHKQYGVKLHLVESWLESL